MLKTVLVPLVLPLLLFFGNGSDKSATRLKQINNGSENSVARVNRNSQEGPESQTGTLEKMMVVDGSAALDVDLNRLNGIGSPSRIKSLRFTVSPDSFFTILVLDKVLRGPQPGSMALIPQSSASLPAALDASFHQLIIEKAGWTEPFDIVVRDGKTGFTFFNIEGNLYDYDAKAQVLNIKEGRLLISEEFAAELGRPADAGSVVGNISITATMRAIEITHVVNGEATSAVLPPHGTGVPGPDVIVGVLPAVQQFGGTSGTQVGLAVATDSCNAGAEPLHWFQLPNNDHPVIPQNLYRMSGGATNDDRFEQIGQSWVKHAFTALQQDACGFGCQSSGTGTLLGAGCSDPYSAGLNGSQNGIGSRAWVNPFTGAFPGSSPSPNSHTGHSHTSTSHRLLVETSDLNTTLNPGATYYAEAQYVTPHEYAWCQSHPGQCNMYNNVSHRRFNVSGGTPTFSFSAVGSTVQTKPAVVAWTGASHSTLEPAPGVDGVASVSYKVTNPSPGLWHYEYIVYNQNLDRAIQSFSVPLAPGITITNIGFHAPPQPAAFANDGTVGSAGYSSAPWTVTQNSNSLTWNSETFAQNQNANAIRWGTGYNFRFDSNQPPQTTNSTIGFFKTGTPMSVSVQGPAGAGPTPTPTPTPQPGVNVALAANGGVATASSTHSAGYSVVGVNNGERSGANWGNGTAGWNDGTANIFPDWVEVAFNGTKTINEIDVFSVQDNYTSPSTPTEAMTFTLYGLTAFEAQYWNGAAWVTVPGGNVTGNNLVWRKITFSPVMTTKIRIHITDSADHLWSRITEIEAYTADGAPTPTPTPTPGPGVNVALAANGGVATASSTHSAGYSVVGVNNGERSGANWGNGTAGWNDGTANIFPDWVEVAFSGSPTINEIDVFSVQDNYTSPSPPTETTTFTLYGLTAFEAQYWDGAGWVTVPGGNVTGNNLVWRRITFSPVTTTKIRIHISDAADHLWSRVTEIEAYTADGAPTPTPTATPTPTPTPGPGVNVALAANGGVATASSTHSAGYSVVGVNNGERSGANWGNGTAGWNDGTANIFPDWVEVAFNGTKTINEIDVFSVQDNYTSPSTPTEAMTFTLYGLTAFEAQYWDGAGWVTVPGGNVTGNNLVWRKITFSPVMTTKIRIHITDAADHLWSRITEIEAYTPTPSFHAISVAGPIANPTAMAFAPDGRLFVCQQTGQLRVIEDGVLLPDSFVNLTVNFSGERGLLGVAFDPNFADNQLVYVYYTSATAPIHNRVTRFTAVGNVAEVGSEEPILELNNLSATNHNGGAIHFGPDNKLYIAVGENANPANSQSVGNLLGKILRINSDGTIPSDNPTTFPGIAGSPSGVNQAIWTVGLRNPYTFDFQPGSGRMFINDVGQLTWEEINDGIAGSNYGWSNCEGPCNPPNANFRDPLFQYGHGIGPATGCAITGGAFYNPTVVTYPSDYVGKYFYAEFCSGWIRRFDPATSTSQPFVSGLSSPVDLKVGPDGNLYYLVRGGGGGVFKIVYS